MKKTILCSRISAILWMAVMSVMLIAVLPASAWASDHYINAYQTSNLTVYSGSTDKSFSMMGIEYHYGAAPTNYTSDRTADFNLDRQFSQVTFDVGVLSGKTGVPDADVYVYYDNDTVPSETFEASNNMITKHVTLNTAGKSLLRIRIKTSGSGSTNWYGIGNVIGYGGHIFDSSNVTTAPTLTASGVQTDTCSVCGAKRTSSLPAKSSCNPFLSPYTVSNLVVYHTMDRDKYFEVMGRKYYLGIFGSNYTRTKEAAFNLGGKYKQITFTVGHVDGNVSSSGTGYLYVYLDDPDKASDPYMMIPISPEMLSTTVTIPTAGKTQMILYMSTSSANAFYAVYDITPVQSAVVAHTFVKKDTVPATDTSTGLRTVTCTVCGLSYTETIPKTGSSSGSSSDTGTGSVSGSSVSLSAANVVLEYTSVVYDGSFKEPSTSVTVNGSTLAKGTDYNVAYSSNLHAGTASVTITGIGRYTGTKKISFTIQKASQKLRLKTASKKLKYSSLKKRNASFSLSVTGAKGKLTFAKTFGTNKIVISKKGTVKVKKGISKGTYKVKVRISAAGTEDYKARTITKTITIKVK